VIKDFTDIEEKIVELYKGNTNDIHAIQMYDEYKLSLLENERYDFPKQDVLIGIIAPAFGCEGGGL